MYINEITVHKYSFRIFTWLKGSLKQKKTGKFWPKISSEAIFYFEYL